MKIYQLNDYEWWAANSLEEAIQTALKETGMDRAEMLPDEEIDPPHEVPDKALDTLKYGEEQEDGTIVSRTFREELNLRVAAGEGPGFFATTEW